MEDGISVLGVLLHTLLLYWCNLYFCVVYVIYGVFVLCCCIYRWLMLFIR